MHAGKLREFKTDPGTRDSSRLASPLLILGDLDPSVGSVAGLCRVIEGKLIADFTSILFFR